MDTVTGQEKYMYVMKQRMERDACCQYQTLHPILYSEIFACFLHFAFDFLQPFDPILSVPQNLYLAFPVLHPLTASVSFHPLH